MEATLLRKVQLEQLEIAKEIRRVCEENDIRYFLAYGTMLGAVRHQGFIPWDDDMDMGMVRSEYEKFCRIAPEKLDPSDNLRSVERIWCEELADYSFEGEIFKGPKDFDGLLTATYGAYMQLPPEDERENRHQIEEVSFGE